MSLYRAIDVVMETVPTMDGDGIALVLARDGRMALERGDCSYASWLTMCQADAQRRINILVRL